MQTSGQGRPTPGYRLHRWFADEHFARVCRTALRRESGESSARDDEFWASLPANLRGDQAGLARSARRPLVADTATGFERAGSA